MHAIQCCARFTSPDWGFDSRLQVDPHTLASTAPNASFALRATVLAVQTDSAADWIADVAALLATATPAAAARTAHEDWWAGFWGRSYIAVNESQWPPPHPPPTPPPPPPPLPPPPPPPAASLPVTGAVLWLRASALASSHNNGQPVAAWSEASLPGANVSQSNIIHQPTFVANAFGAAPAVRFDGVDDFLGNPRTLLPGGATGSTHFAVLRDAGSTTICCSGVTYWRSADVGISTRATGGSAVHILADGPGVDVEDTIDVLNRIVIADATYAAAGTVRVSAAACSTNGTYSWPPGAGRGVMIGTRNNELQRYFKGDIGEVIVYPRALSQTERAAVLAYLATQWPQADGRASAAECGDEKDSGYNASQMCRKCRRACFPIIPTGPRFGTRRYRSVSPSGRHTPRSCLACPCRPARPAHSCIPVSPFPLPNQ